MKRAHLARPRHGGTLGTVAGRDNIVGLLKGFIGAFPDLNAADGKIVEEWAYDDLPARHPERHWVRLATLARLSRSSSGGCSTGA